MFMKGIFMLFVSLGIGYLLCYLAKREKGIMKSVGYTFGVSLIVLSLAYSLAETYGSGGMRGHHGWMKHCPGMMRSCAPGMK